MIDYEKAGDNLEQVAIAEAAVQLSKISEFIEDVKAGLKSKVRGERMVAIATTLTLSQFWGKELMERTNKNMKHFVK